MASLDPVQLTAQIKPNISERSKVDVPKDGAPFKDATLTPAKSEKVADFLSVENKADAKIPASKATAVTLLRHHPDQITDFPELSTNHDASNPLITSGRKPKTEHQKEKAREKRRRTKERAKERKKNQTFANIDEKQPAISASDSEPKSLEATSSVQSPVAKTQSAESLKKPSEVSTPVSVKDAYFIKVNKLQTVTSEISDKERVSAQLETEKDGLKRRLADSTIRHQRQSGRLKSSQQTWDSSTLSYEIEGLNALAISCQEWRVLARKFAAGNLSDELKFQLKDILARYQAYLEANPSAQYAIFNKGQCNTEVLNTHLYVSFTILVGYTDLVAQSSDNFEAFASRLLQQEKSLELMVSEYLDNTVLLNIHKLQAQTQVIGIYNAFTTSQRRHCVFTPEQLPNIQLHSSVTLFSAVDVIEQCDDLGNTLPPTQQALLYLTLRNQIIDIFGDELTKMDCVWSNWDKTTKPETLNYWVWRLRFSLLCNDLISMPYIFQQLDKCADAAIDLSMLTKPISTFTQILECFWMNHLRGIRFDNTIYQFVLAIRVSNEQGFLKLYGVNDFDFTSSISKFGGVDTSALSSEESTKALAELQKYQLNRSLLALLVLCLNIEADCKMQEQRSFLEEINAQQQYDAYLQAEYQKAEQAKAELERWQTKQKPLPPPSHHNKKTKHHKRSKPSAACNKQSTHYEIPDSLSEAETKDVEESELLMAFTCSHTDLKSSLAECIETIDSKEDEFRKQQAQLNLLEIYLLLGKNMTDRLLLHRRKVMRYQEYLSIGELAPKHLDHSFQQAITELPELKSSADTYLTEGRKVLRVINTFDLTLLPKEFLTSITLLVEKIKPLEDKYTTLEQFTVNLLKIYQQRGQVLNLHKINKQGQDGLRTISLHKVTVEVAAQADKDIIHSIADWKHFTAQTRLFIESVNLVDEEQWPALPPASKPRASPN
ncbi:hypothetical protein D5018_18910 [Parashewanella curva]|uniref:Uncharacterized protein n=1 Tax=Parashewanella curva TaxID=2338552 RepID=A0A3L8PVP1_9GAMM|nr:hypothetical protein [Parashewanella curva]RLV58132.1 hypothetical protein D5018_18910 [Parashewanella curva]